MQSSWVWKSAGALVTGVLALFAGALLMPATGGDAAEWLRLVEDQDGRWLGVGVMFFGAGVGLLLGLPACLTLFPARGRVVGGVGVVVMAVAAAATTGYAMLVVFFRALVLADAVVTQAFDEVLADPGLRTLLLVWVACFYLGELLLAIAVLRAGTVARWVPAVLFAHVATWPLSTVLPDEAGGFLVGLTVLGFSGLAFGAVAEQQRTSVVLASTAATRPRPLG